MSEPAHLRVYRLDAGTVFEGGLVGAVERMQLGGDAKLLDFRLATEPVDARSLADAGPQLLAAVGSGSAT